MSHIETQYLQHHFKIISNVSSCVFQYFTLLVVTILGFGISRCQRISMSPTWNIEVITLPSLVMAYSGCAGHPKKKGCIMLHLQDETPKTKEKPWKNQAFLKGAQPLHLGSFSWCCVFLSRCAIIAFSWMPLRSTNCSGSSTTDFSTPPVTAPRRLPCTDGVHVASHTWLGKKTVRFFIKKCPTSRGTKHTT